MYCTKIQKAMYTKNVTQNFTHNYIFLKNNQIAKFSTVRDSSGLLSTKILLAVFEITF